MKTLRTILITIGIATAFSTPCFAVEYFLRADVNAITMPDGNVIPVWGFARDSSFGALDGDVNVPGPLLVVPPGEDLIIHLDNNLTVPVSIVINGQTAIMVPVYDPNTNRVRSFTHETEPGNTDPCDYIWTNFRPGSYIYESGTHPTAQIPMGLYGGVIKDFAAGQAYDGVAYDVNVPLFFSEIDPSVNNAVATNNFGFGKTMTSLIDYEPKYFLLNGQPFVAGSMTPILPAGNAGDAVLLRLFNIGLETRAPLVLGDYMMLVAEDGQEYTFPKEEYVAFLSAGKTIDALVTLPADGLYPIFDRRLGLTNAQASDGGMLAYLLSGALNPTLSINSVTADPNSILDTRTSQLVVDANLGTPLPLTYNWTVPVGAGSLNNPAIAYPVYTPPNVVSGSQIFTLTVDVNNGINAATGTVDITVTNDLQPVINSVTATPNSILDTQTTQLMVDANDDGGVSMLTYRWIVPRNGGSVSDSSIANPVYTPPDVTRTRTYRLTVQVSDGLHTVSRTVNVTVANGHIVSTNFNANAGGFAYRDNTFRDTTASAYASGGRVRTDGFTGGALRVLLGGGRTNVETLGMSGGFRRAFRLTTATAGNVNISFRYKLSQSPNYENDEFSDMMLSLDGALMGISPNDYLAQVTGNGEGGNDVTTGWQSFMTTVNLAAGTHTIIIGGYNNKKTDTNELTTILIDDVVLWRD